MTEEVQEQVVEQPQEEKVYTFQLTTNEANVVIAGLGELPAKVSIGVIQKLQAQAAQQ